MSEREALLRRYHAADPGATSRAFARTGSYARLAALVAGRERVLDLACGDGPLLAELGPRAIGVDMSHEELVAAHGRDDRSRLVQARVQALPFADGAFDACTCHLAFMLFDDLERVVAELHRVIEPGGVFAALIGAGPVEPPGDRDAFHRFLALARPLFNGLALGDPRAKSEAGWRELFAGWSEPRFERIVLELGGTFDEAWDFLGGSYAMFGADAAAVRAQLHEELGDRVTCEVVCWLASAIRR